MNSKVRIVLLSIAAFLIAAAIVYGYREKPVNVDTALVDIGAIQVMVTEEGVTRVIDRFLVSAPVAGYARRIELHVGDEVKKGQTLVRIEPLPSTALDPRSKAEAEARISAASAALSSAEERARALAADAKIARLEAERVKKLFGEGFVSTEDYERAEAARQGSAAQLRSAEFTVKVSKYELEAAKTALGFTGVKKTSGNNYGKIVLSSPIAGRVLKVIHESEGVVANGEPLIEIGNPRAIEVATDLLSADSVKVGPGTKVIFERWGGETSLEGRVRVVEPAGFTKVSALGVEEQRVLVISDITSAPRLWERLGDGFRVESSFIIWEGDGLKRVPMSALFRDSGKAGGWSVFLYKDGRAVKRAVEIGHRSGLSAEVIGGLKEGSEVITHPDEKIEDNSKVLKR
jgi:HlyD family secretion protein